MKKLLFTLLLTPVFAWGQGFQIGDNIQVVAGISCVNVRSEFVAASVLKCEPPGVKGVVKSAATRWGNFDYYQILYADGIQGWSAGIYLEKTSGPPTPPPSGSLSVTPLPGPVTLSFTAEGDTLLSFEGISGGKVSGTITVIANSPSAYSMILYGLGGVTRYTVSTNEGVPLPMLDSARIAQSAYNKGLQDGALSVGVSNVTIGLSNGKQVIR